VHNVKFGVFFMLDLGNQIGGGDVDEVAGGERKQESQRRKEVVEQCRVFFLPAVDQNAEVS
jgi:hypothetical protein